LANIRIDGSGVPVFKFQPEFSSLPDLGTTVSENANEGAYDGLLSSLEHNIAMAIVACFNNTDAHHELCLFLESLNGSLAQFRIDMEANARLRELAGG